VEAVSGDAAFEGKHGVAVGEILQTLEDNTKEEKVASGYNRIILFCLLKSPTFRKGKGI
jgi:uncharacterized protein (DUF433 family)